MNQVPTESPSGLIDPHQTWGDAIAVLCAGGREPPRDIAAATVAHAIAAVLNRRVIEYTWYDVYDWVWEGDWWGDRAASYNPEDLASEWEAHPE